MAFTVFVIFPLLDGRFISFKIMNKLFYQEGSYLAHSNAQYYIMNSYHVLEKQFESHGYSECVLLFILFLLVNPVHVK